MNVYGSCVEISSYIEEKVIDDAAVDQFCDEQKNVGRVSVSFGSYDSVPGVDFVLPGDDRRERYENILTGV